MENRLLVAWLLVMGVFPNLLHAAPLCTRYVATSGHDASGCGTSGSPCATIAYVDTNIVSAGDTVCVASGTYTGSFQTSKNGTVSLRIRFISYPSKWGAILVGNTTGDGTAAWTSLGSYIDIVGFDVTAQSSSASPAIGILNDGKYDRISGNRVHDLTTPCNPNGNGGAGIDDGSQTNGGYSQFSGNFVFNILPAGGTSCQNNADVHPVGIYLQSPYSAASDNLIVGTPIGIQMYHDTFDELVVNNTVVCPSSYASVNTFGIIVSASTPGVTNDWTVVANNITDDCSYGVQEEAPTGGNNNYVNNDDYNSPNPLTIVGGGARSGNITSNPLFVNDTGDSSGNYQLQSASPAKDAGANYSFAPFVDFRGGIRPDTASNKWDMGAYEYGSSAGTWPWF